MGKRLLVGLVEGLVLGAALATALVAGLGRAVASGWVGYGLAALAGALTALVAGKPVWAKEAKLEVGLKAVIGGSIALVALYAVRRWLAIQVDLSAIGAGRGIVGELVAVFVPVITTGLSILFELDNDEASAAAPPPKRVEGPRARVSSEVGTSDEAASGETPARVRKG